MAKTKGDDGSKWTPPAFRVDAAAVFSFYHQPINDIKGDCLVVLDTNVLLAPYATSPNAFTDISRIYEKLLGQNRLFIPSQVAREYAANRAQKLSELYKQVSDLRGKQTPELIPKRPFLEVIPGYKTALELEAKMKEALKDYQSALGEVVAAVKSWAWEDPISELYRRLFTPSTIIETNDTPDSIAQELAWHIENKAPPGYKDASKQDLGVGDLIIWHAILQLAQTAKKNLIFVTGDEKSDWFHRSDKQSLFPRYELIEEFRVHSDGHSLHLMQLPDFLTLFGVEDTIVEEVKDAIEAIPESQSAVRYIGVQPPRTRYTEMPDTTLADEAFSLCRELNGMIGEQWRAFTTIHGLPSDLGIDLPAALNRDWQLKVQTTFNMLYEPKARFVTQAVAERVPTILNPVDAISLCNPRSVDDVKQLVLVLVEACAYLGNE